MHTLFATRYDFPLGALVPIFVGTYLFIIIIINLFVIFIETIVLRKMNFGNLPACLLASFLMNLISTLAGHITSVLALTSCDIECQNSLLNLFFSLPGTSVDLWLRISFFDVSFLGICYVLTVVLEMAVLFILRREHAPRKIGKMVLVINLFSYLFLFALCILIQIYVSSASR